ncbi:MAG: DNA polymerase III subunit delta, partial [Clostridia bacterium]|nr:DNA polymerase III subunit delta [Clostridia bacterium]
RMTELTDAIAGGNFDKAASVLGDLLSMGEPPIKLLSVLGKQLRQLYSARLALEERKGSQYLVELWGMRSPYPAQKLMSAAQRFGLSWCRMAVTEAEKADLAMKSTGADGEEVLIGLLLKLANTKGK